jgi:hypothetical protein
VVKKHLKEFTIEADGKTHPLAIRRPTRADLDQAEAAVARERETAIRSGCPLREQAHQDALERLSPEAVRELTGLDASIRLGEAILADPTSAPVSKRVMAECMLRWRAEFSLLMDGVVNRVLDSVESRCVNAHFQQLLVLTVVKRHNGKRVYSSRSEYIRSPGPLRDAITEAANAVLTNPRRYPEEDYLRGIGLDPDAALANLIGMPEKPATPDADQKVEFTGFVNDLTPTATETPAEQPVA